MNKTELAEFRRRLIEHRSGRVPIQYLPSNLMASLLADTQHTDQVCRSYAAHCLGLLEVIDNAAQGRLIELCQYEKEKKPPVREAAALGLLSLGGNANVSKETVQELLQSPKTTAVQRIYLRGLHWPCFGDKSTLDDLATKLRDHSMKLPELKAHLRVWEQYGCHAGVIHEDITRLAKSEDDGIRRLAYRVARTSSLPIPRLLCSPILTDAANASDRRTRDEAVFTLRTLGIPESSLTSEPASASVAAASSKRFSMVSDEFDRGQSQPRQPGEIPSQFDDCESIAELGLRIEELGSAAVAAIERLLASEPSDASDVAHVLRKLEVVQTLANRFSDASVSLANSALTELVGKKLTTGELPVVVKEIRATAAALQRDILKDGQSVSISARSSNDYPDLGILQVRSAGSPHADRKTSTLRLFPQIQFGPKSQD